MKKLFVVVLIVGLIWVFKPEWLPFNNHTLAFDSNGDPEVWIFTLNRCRNICASVRSDMGERGVPYREFNIDSNEKYFELWKTYNKDDLPLFVIGDHIIDGYRYDEVISSLAETYGQRYLTRAESAYMGFHFNDDGSPRIVMYGTSWCPYCKKMREKFNDKNIEFVDIDVEKPRVLKDLMKTLNITGYPITYVGYQRFEGVEEFSAVINAAGYGWGI